MILPDLVTRFGVDVLLLLACGVICVVGSTRSSSLFRTLNFSLQGRRCRRFLLTSYPFSLSTRYERGSAHFLTTFPIWSHLLSPGRRIRTTVPG